MPDNEGECSCGWVTFFMCLLVAVVVGTFTWAATDYRWKADAVRKGHAHVVIEDEYGNVKWEWLQR